MRRLLTALACVLVSLTASADGFAPSGDPELLVVESRIPLGDIRGRIDHLGVDVKRQRLYVAELGNDSVAVIDLKERKTIRTLTGLQEPQGIGYVPSADCVFVANGKSGVVQVYRGADLMPVAQIALVDRATNRQVASWPTNEFRANYPLTLEEPPRERVLAIFRRPAKLAVFQATDGRRLSGIDTCGDSDDAFVDPGRNRVYVICGEGVVDVFAAQGDTYARVG